MTSYRQFSKLARFAGESMIASLLLLSPIALCAEDSHAGHNHGSEAHGDEGHEEHSDEVSLSPEALKMFDITLDTASRRVLTDAASVPARVAYNGEAMAHVGTPVAGRVSEIKVRLGDTIGKGDLLAVIASPELGEAESDFLQKRSLLDSARSTVEFAHVTFQRAEELRKTNSLSVTDFLARQGELKKAEGELRVAEAAHIAAENRLHILGIDQEQVKRLVETGEVSSRFELRAPIAGTIIQREVTPGEVVGPDRDSLLVIADMTTLWILADLPERLAHRVQPGSKGRILIGFAEGSSLAGTVGYVAPELNPRTRTAQVRLVVDAASVTAPTSTGDAETHVDHAGHDHDEAHEDNALTEDQIAAFKAKGDWCGEHGVPESTCALCNPSLAAPPKTEPIAVKAGALLKPGMFAEVELELAAVEGSREEPVLAIPEEALQTVEGRVSVFVPADEPNSYKPQPVTIGRRVGRFVQVISGLKEGDRYIATGSFILKAEHGKAGAEHVH